MESFNNSWDLPEDPFERKEKVAQLADELCDKFDKIYYEFMNKILEEVRANNRIEIQRNLGSQALKESESPKAP